MFTYCVGTSNLREKELGQLSRAGHLDQRSPESSLEQIPGSLCRFQIFSGRKCLRLKNKPNSDLIVLSLLTKSILFAILVKANLFVTSVLQLN